MKNKILDGVKRMICLVGGHKIKENRTIEFSAEEVANKSYEVIYCTYKLKQTCRTCSMEQVLTRIAPVNVNRKPQRLR